MKKIVIIAMFAGILGGCKSTQVTSGADDVYVNPAEERMLAKQAAEEKARKEAAERKQREEAAAATKNEEKAEDQPLYKDPEYNSDDYYDYEYASRLNRFYNPIYGAGYYDPYYTNMYSYNQNPAFYGTSIYSSSMWMPSVGFNNFSIGFSSGWGYNNFYNGFYNPYSYYPWYSNYGYYGYSPWGYDPWGYNSGFYSGYNMGYYNGWNNAQWGYLNKYDANSGYSKMAYGPRGSNVGGNDQQRTTPGMNRPADNYIQTVAEEQSRLPRFSANDQRANSTRVSNRAQRPAGGNIEPTKPSGNQPTNTERRTRSRETQPGQQPSNTRVRRNRSDNQQPQQNQQQQRSGGTVNPSPTPSPVSPGNSGGGSTPRNSGGGGNSRPR